ncbi:MAG: hypothetical protein PVH85_33165 [Desulfobacterales bacterium]|jgi:hypothetical protein
MKDRYRVVVHYGDGIGETESTVLLETAYLSIAIMEAKQIAMDYSLNQNQVEVLKLEETEWIPYKISDYNH